jgi:hypothetical protein
VCGILPTAAAAFRLGFQQVPEPIHVLGAGVLGAAFRRPTVPAECFMHRQYGFEPRSARAPRVKRD